MHGGLRPRALLERLLGDLSPEAFLESHWEQKPLHVKGTPDKWDVLTGFRLDLEGFEALTQGLESQVAGIRGLYRARKAEYEGFFLRHGDHGAYVADLSAPRPTRYIPRQEIPEALASGCSVQLNGIEGLLFGPEPLSRWAKFADMVRAALHYPGEFFLGATRSPAGACFHAHYDPSPGFILQTYGRKRYTFSDRPVKPWPNRKGYRMPDGGFKYAGETREAPRSDWEAEGDGGEMSSLVLEAGDLLYLPPGVLHQTEALEPSIAVLMLPPNVRFNAVLAEILDQSLGHLEAWRRTPAWVGEGEAGLPPSWILQNRELLRAVRDVVSKLDPAGFELTAGWKALAARSTVAEQLDPPREARESLSKTDQLRVDPDVNLLLASGKDRTGQKRATLYHRSRKLDVEGAWVELFRRLPRDRSFRAEEAMGWRGPWRTYPWEGARACLEALLREGVLLRA